MAGNRGVGMVGGLMDDKCRVRYDEYGQPVALMINGWDVAHVVPSIRTKECLEAIAAALSSAPRQMRQGILSLAMESPNRDA